MSTTGATEALLRTDDGRRVTLVLMLVTDGKPWAGCRDASSASQALLHGVLDRLRGYGGTVCADVEHVRPWTRAQCGPAD